MAKSIFDHLKAITKDKIQWDSLSEEDKKSWDDYMITRWLSMNPAYLGFVNDLQMIRQNGIDSKTYYTMLLNALPKSYVYVKYIKKPRTYENKKELLAFLASVYNISKRECLDYIELFHKLDMKEDFEYLMQAHGIQDEDKKKLRKEMFDDE